MQLFKWCRNLSAGTVLQSCMQLFKPCQNLSAGTVLKGCSCLSGVITYLLELCCRGAAVSAVSKPICWQCAAGVQLIKQCRNLSAGTVLQRCSSLSGVKTIHGDSVAGLQLFKWCRNLSAGTVLQRCSCLSGVETYLPGLCCMGAAV